MKNTRHPAVIDLLGGTSESATTRTPKSPTPSKAPKTPRPPKPERENPVQNIRHRYVAAAIVVLALLGWFVLRLFGGEEPAPTALVDDTSSIEPTPTLAATPPPLDNEPTPAAEAADLCRTDPGDQKSGSGVIAAFEHAYYVARSGDAVRALATPDSPLPQGAAIQTAGIDTVPPGTTHCVRITPVNTTDTTGVYTVVLAEMRPGQPPVQWPQTITTKQLDGRWFIDVISK